MVKKTVWFMVLLLMAVPSFAQFRAGVKGGGNISSMNMNIGGVELDIHEPRFGVHGGLMGEYMFSTHFGLQAELNYVFCGANINAARYTQGLDVPEGLSLEGYVSRHVFHLPLYLKTKFRLFENTKLYVMGGGVASFSPSAHQHIKQTYEGEYLKTKWSLYEPKIRILDEESDNVYMMQRWNAGLAAEAGVEVNDRMTVGVGFKHVLNNMSGVCYLGTIMQPETRMWIASLSVGYFF